MANITYIEVFEYLDDLRESGAVNMFGAAIYVSDHFDLHIGLARGMVSAWMETFDSNIPAAERVERYLQEQG